MNRYRRLFRTLLIFVVCSLLISGLGLLVFRLTTIQNLQVEGLPAEITFDAEKIPQSLLLFPEEKVKNEILTAYPFIQDVVIEKKLPSTLRVILIPRDPVAIIATPTRRVYVAADGMILSDASIEKYPIIQVEHMLLRPGLIIDDQAIRESLAFLSQMSQDENIQLLSFSKNEQVIRVATPTYTVLLSPKKNGIESARTLQSVLTGFRIKGQIPQQIDIRFDQPVVQ